MDLLQELNAAQMAGVGVYALIDPALRPEIVRHGMAGSSRHTLAASGVSTTASEAAQVLPFLISLGPSLEARSGQLATLEKWALESHAVTWMASALTAEVIAQQLGKRMNAMLTDDQPVILRFSDARILPNVHAVLTTEQRAQFFSPMAHWWYLDRQENCQCIRTEAAQSGDAWPSPWILTAAQERALLQGAEADTVLALLHEQARDDLLALPRAQRHHFVSDQITQAKPWGIDSAQQQALFCTVAMAVGADFSQQAKWQVELAKVRDGQQTLTQAIKQFEGASE